VARPTIREICLESIDGGVRLLAGPSTRDLAWISEKHLGHRYDPELLLRILLIGYLYGITSERKLVEELRMHLAWRWFTGLSFDQEIPRHSTFSKNRHGRFQRILLTMPSQKETLNIFCPFRFDSHLPRI
jgi:Transposase domain (DUF772)